MYNVTIKTIQAGSGKVVNSEDFDTQHEADDEFISICSLYGLSASEDDLIAGYKVLNDYIIVRITEV